VEIGERHDGDLIVLRPMGTDRPLPDRRGQRQPSPQSRCHRNPRFLLRGNGLQLAPDDLSDRSATLHQLRKRSRLG
jgi:hypothetical protein